MIRLRRLASLFTYVNSDHNGRCPGPVADGRDLAQGEGQIAPGVARADLGGAFHEKQEHGAQSQD